MYDKFYYFGELQTPEVLDLMNFYIRQLNIDDYYDLTNQQKGELISLVFKADDSWASEALVNNNGWNAIKLSISSCIKHNEPVCSHMLGDIIRECMMDYFEQTIQEIYTDQVTNYKCDVTHEAQEGYVFDKQRV